VRLLLDEMYSPEIARQLRQRGHDVVSAKERPELIGATDADLLGRMSDEDRVIMTNNALDFVPLVSRLLAEGGQHAGLLLTSDRSLPRTRAMIGRFVEVLDELLRQRPEEKDLRSQIRWLP